MYKIEYLPYLLWIALYWWYPETIILCILFGGFMNYIYKHVLNYLLEKKSFSKIFYRPNNQSKWGMPSGHAQIMGFLTCAFIYLKQWKIVACLIPMNILVWYDKIQSGDHTQTQYIVGYLIGIMSVLPFVNIIAKG